MGSIGTGDFPLLSGNYGVLRAGVRLGTLARAGYLAVGGFFGAAAKGLRIREGSALAKRSQGHSLPQFVCTRKASAIGVDYVGMKRIPCLFLLIFASLVSFAAESAFLVRRRVSEVQLALVATDPKGRPRLDLSPSDIIVLEDGRPVPRFELRSAADLPLRIGVVLDLSDSTVKSWAAVGSALVRSLQQVMRPNDQLLVLAFNSKIELERTVSDPVQLGEILAHPSTGGLTSLYDTVFHACDEPVFSDEREPHRSAMILFSDGEDDLSLRGLPDAIARAERRGVAIYTVAAHDPKKRARGDAVLRDLALATGGRDYIVKNARQLGDALSAINEELRSSYVLYYPVPQDSGNQAFRRVHVIPRQADSVLLRSRAGYFTSP